MGQKYLSNGDSVGEFYCTIGLRTIKNGGGRSPQNPKKKTQFWWGHTCNPKPGQKIDKNI